MNFLLGAYYIGIYRILFICQLIMLVYRYLYCAGANLHALVVLHGQITLYVGVEKKGLVYRYLLQYFCSVEQLFIAYITKLNGFNEAKQQSCVSDSCIKSLKPFSYTGLIFAKFWWSIEQKYYRRYIRSFFSSTQKEKSSWPCGSNVASC